VLHYELFRADTISTFESRSHCGCGPFTRLSGYVPVSPRSIVLQSAVNVGGLSGCWAAVMYGFNMVWNLIATVLHIFGVYDALSGCGRWLISLPGRLMAAMGVFSYQPLATADTAVSDDIETASVSRNAGHPGSATYSV
jgi:hypothetical protein